MYGSTDGVAISYLRLHGPTPPRTVMSFLKDLHIFFASILHIFAHILHKFAHILH